MNYIYLLLFVSHFVAILTGMFILRLIDLYFNNDDK
jgi:hypothetical protein